MKSTMITVSCSKEETRPTTTDTVAPVWKANTGGNENVNNHISGGLSQGGITDPEHNKEESSNTDGF